MTKGPAFDRLVTDALTGTLAHRYLRLRIEEELQRAARYGRPLALVLVDLDDLRGINDRYGRAAGDFVLQQLGTTLQVGARAVDRVGRWTGGGFALLLPETDGGSAYALAERLRSTVAARRLRSDGGALHLPRRVTVCCGAAAAQSAGHATLLLRADQALERAKAGGPNRSVVDG